MSNDTLPTQPSITQRIRAAILKHKLARHLATADMTTRRDQRQAERLRDQIEAIARREALR